MTTIGPGGLARFQASPQKPVNTKKAEAEYKAEKKLLNSKENLLDNKVKQGFNRFH